MADFEVIVGADLRQYNAAMQSVGNASRKTANEVEGNLDKIGKEGGKAANTFNNLGKAVVGAFALDRIVALGKAMVDITAKFEKYNAVLTNTLGSQAAAASTLDTIRAFAAATPFAVDELTASYIKLANQGFLPTRKQLTQLGDLASSTGKNFDQLTEAILDAQQGEFERLKEFGIRAQDNGDKVTFTFKGVQTQVDKTAVSIRDYITALGGAEGVSGSMAAISQTLTGQISNLGDSWDALLVSFGNRTSGIFKSVITNINDLLTRLTEVNRNIDNAEKVGEGKGFFDDYLDRVKSMFTGRQTSTDIIGQEVEFRKNQFLELANAATEGAKTAKDYDKAITTVSDAYKKEGQRIAGSKSLMAALRLAYENAIALITSQKDAKSKEGTGNFGSTGTTKKAKQGLDLLQQEIAEMETQLEKSVIAGTTQMGDVDSPLVRKIKAAKEELESFKEVFDQVQAGQLKNNVYSGKEAGVGKQALPGGEGSGVAEDMQAYAKAIEEGFPTLEAYTKYLNAIQNRQEAIKVVQSQLAEQIAGSLTDSIYTAITTGQNAFASFGQLIAQLLIKIAVAIAAAAALAAILSLVFPSFSITQGVSNFSSLASSLSGIAGLGGALGGIPGHAEGGITTRAHLAMVGEGGESEVIAPLSKFNQMVEDRASTNGGSMSGEFKVKGTDLILVLQRAQQSKGRRG